MGKTTTTRWWVSSWLAWIPAGVLVWPSALALADHDAGSGDAFGRTMVVLIAVGGVSLALGAALQVIAWGGAVGNTRPLSDPQWFRALLWGGTAGLVTLPLFGVGALLWGSVMMAYLVAAPDGLAAEPRPTTPAKPTITKWSGIGFAVAGAAAVASLIVARLTDPGAPLHGHEWLALTLVATCFTVAVLAYVLVWAAWWGALFNAHRLADQTWFKRLCWTGVLAAVTMPLLGLGVLIQAIVLVAYAHSAPDAIAVQPPVQAPSGQAENLTAAR
jgi:hypothetical protein